MVVPVPVRETLGEALCKLGLLRADQVEDREAIGKVLAALIDSFESKRV